MAQSGNAIVDYHGFTVEQALKDLVQRLWSLDTAKYRELEIITGHGVIHDEVTDYLKLHEIEWKHKLGNDGCVIVTVPHYEGEK